jgi:endonuclease/exonuclease/phosphatase (EEP) superfamily protein YafD
VLNAEREHDNHSFPGMVVDAIVLCLLLAAVTIVATRFLSWSNASAVLLGQSAFPVVMLVAWAALVITVWRGQPIRAGLAILLCVAHLAALQPALRDHETPVWAKQATTFRLVSSNVYFENTDPDLGPTLAGLQADVAVFCEFPDSIAKRLSNDGALDRFEFRATDGLSPTNVAIYSRYPFVGTPRSIGLKTGPEHLLAVDVNVRGTIVRVIGVHPSPGLDRGHAAFLETMRVLREEVRQSPYPIVLAGDFNGSRWVPAVGELFGAGLTSAHEAAGHGLSSSWPVVSWGPIFMRLDHVLYSKDVSAVKVVDAVVPGSDHRAIVADLALRRRGSP